MVTGRLVHPIILGQILDLVFRPIANISKGNRRNILTTDCTTLLGWLPQITVLSRAMLVLAKGLSIKENGVHCFQIPSL